VFIARAICGMTLVTVAALCRSYSLLCISKRDWATENEAGRTMGINGNEEPAGEMSPIQFSCNCNDSLITHNTTPVHSTWGLLRVCAACPTPRLNLSCELRHSENNIQDTFPTGSTQGTTNIQWQYCLNYSSPYRLLSRITESSKVIVVVRDEHMTKLRNIRHASVL